MNLRVQRQALEKLLAEYESNLNDLKRRARESSQSDDNPVASDVPTHDADAGTVLFERERNEAFGEDYAATLKQIYRALVKMDEGSYGICDNCHKPIPVERLKALPFANLGIDCQERLERL